MIYYHCGHNFGMLNQDFRAPNIQVVILGRFLQGGFASTGATMVGGTITIFGLPPSEFVGPEVIHRNVIADDSDF